MFIVTEDWITRNTTKRGGYKAAQLKAIGVSWPPAGGWKQRVSGRLLSPENKRIFESYSGGTSVTVSTVVVPTCNCKVLAWEECEHTVPCIKG